MQYSTVDYLGNSPFGVLMDSKRRVLWFGNPITTDNDFFRKITE